MSKESAQAALNKFAEAVNTGKFELFDQVVAPDCLDHDPADGQVPGPARPPARRSKSAECRSPNSKTARWSSVGEAPTKEPS
jgi:hypothetical protein